MCHDAGRPRRSHGPEMSSDAACGRCSFPVFRKTVSSSLMRIKFRTSSRRMLKCVAKALSSLALTTAWLFQDVSLSGDDFDDLICKAVHLGIGSCLQNGRPCSPSFDRWRGWFLEQVVFRVQPPPLNRGLSCGLPPRSRRVLAEITVIDCMAVYAQKGISDSQTTCIRIVGRLHFSQLFLELLWRILQHTSETIAPHREQRQPCRPQEQHITSQSRASSAIRHGGHRPQVE